jgi:hypothetical protein
MAAKSVHTVSTLHDKHRGKSVGRRADRLMKNQSVRIRHALGPDEITLHAKGLQIGAG